MFGFVYPAIMKKLGLFLGFGLLVACGDKAEPGFKECEKLAKAGKLEEAKEVCHQAAVQSPTSDFGIKAIQKIDELTAKLDTIIPPTVTIEWCARLSAKLGPKLTSEAQAKYAGQDPAIVALRVKEHVDNMEYNCRQDAGKPTAGLWACRWNETFETRQACDKLE